MSRPKALFCLHLLRGKIDAIELQTKRGLTPNIVKQNFARVLTKCFHLSDVFVNGLERR